ncbi:MAG: preprotein translocase subunit Sec61beta [Thermoprotei archaeon]|nr:preprotein translocase subunit Sec61beta [Thermoprotei archaeon]
MAARRRRQAGPMSAAGLVSFYEELEGRIKLSPFTVLAIATIFSFIVVLAHLLLP